MSSSENKEYKILQDYKQDLVSEVSSSNVKLLLFSDELYKWAVILKQVKNTFASLDHDRLKCELSVRYLLKHVCEGVEHDVTVFDRFLRVLAGLGGRAEQVSRHLGMEAGVSDREAGTESQAKDRAGSSKVVVHDISLCEDDIPVLMKILVNVTHIWEELSIALGQSTAVREECRSGSSNTVKLNNILCKWVTGKYQSGLPATLSNLKHKLASELVGVASVALNLEEKFREAKRPSVTLLPVAKRPRLDSTLKVVYQPIDTEVSEGKSTLLLIQVSPSQSVSYQWMKDDQFLSDTVAFSGICSDILVIRHASHCTGGKYTCLVSNGSEKVFSEEAVLTVSLPPEKEQLLTLYSKVSGVPQDSWPPQVTSSFINLALIKKKKQGTDDYDYSVRGDIDDIRENKEEVSYDEVFGEYEHGGLVLVEGRPGSGKTTLVHKLSRDWGTKRDMLKNSKVVFYIPLRSLVNRKAEKLSNILEIFYSDQVLCEKVSGDIQRSQGEGVCFIFDGLDEYQLQDEKNSIIHELLEKKNLPAAMIIVASRPLATEKLRRTPLVTKRIEVLGFSEQQIFEYIDKYPFSSDMSKSDSLSSKLKAYLNSHLNILHMCYLPVHVAMICFLYGKKNGDIPPTETKIYELFTTFTVLRKLKRRDENAQLRFLDKIRGEDKDHFGKICHLAYNMTIHSKQVVNQDDVEESLSLGADDSHSLGLVNIDRTAQLYGHDNTYAFLHLTIQEYLAALHLSKLEDEEQMEMIRAYAGEEHMRMVLKFYCGIVNFANKVAQIQEIMSAAHYLGGIILYGIQCAFESQQRVACDSIVERTGFLSLRHYTLTPADLTALAYVISTASHPVINLAIRQCHLYDNHVRVLLREVSYNKLKCIQTLNLSRNNIGADGVAGLAGGLKVFTNLLRLGLSYNKISADGAGGLAVGLKSCTNLQTLDLSYNCIGSGAVDLAGGLKSCSSLQTLELSNNSIGDDGAVGLAGGLKSCTNLQTVQLSSNNIGDDGAVGLAEGLKSCTNLQILGLSFNNIGDDGAVGLAGGLKSCTNLQTLRLTRNSIGADGRAALAHLKCPILLMDTSPPEEYFSCTSDATL